jgi:hypothetical protein
VAGAGAIFLFVNLDAVSAAVRAAAGLRNPGGPIAGPGFGLWQAVFLIALRGCPVNTISRRPRRLPARNALIIDLGALTYLVLLNDPERVVVLRSAHGSARKGSPGGVPGWSARAQRHRVGRLGPRVVLRQQKSYKRLSGLNALVEQSPTG